MSISVKNAAGETVSINTINDLIAVGATAAGQATSTAALAELLTAIGEVDDAPNTDPDVDGSLNANSKGELELLTQLIALMGGDGTPIMMTANGTLAAEMNGPGAILGVTVLTGETSSTLVLWDGLTATGDSVGPIDCGAARSITFGGNGMRFGVGLTLVMAGGASGSDVVVIVRPD